MELHEWPDGPLTGWSAGRRGVFFIIIVTLEKGFANWFLCHVLISVYIKCKKNYLIILLSTHLLHMPETMSIYDNGVSPWVFTFYMDICAYINIGSVAFIQ